MGDLLLIRHVESQYGEGSGERSEGWRDIPPSAKGKKQAEEVAERLADLPIKEVIASDLQRNKILGRAIALATGAQFSTSRGLRSMNVGSLAGRLRTENKDALEYHRKNPDKPFPGGGETFRSYVRRWLSNELPKLQEQAHAMDGDLAAVTHGHNIADAYEYLNGKKLDEMPPTGSVWKVDGRHMEPWEPGDDKKSEKETAGEADYEELDGAEKDAECEIVCVPGGVSSEGGCCKRWKRAEAKVRFFRCETCVYLCEES